MMTNGSNDQLDEYGNTPLHLAILASDFSKVIQLIEDDKNKEEKIINIQAMSNTPLMLALKTGNIKMAEALLDHPDINVNIPDISGMRPIHLACLFRADNLIKKFLEKNPEIYFDSLNEDKNTEALIAKYRRYQNGMTQIQPSHFYKESLLPVVKLSIPDRLYDFSALIVPNFAVLRFSTGNIKPSFFQANLTKKKKDMINDLIHVPLHSLASSAS